MDKNPDNNEQEKVLKGATAGPGESGVTLTSLGELLHATKGILNALEQMREAQGDIDKSKEKLLGFLPYERFCSLFRIDKKALNEEEYGELLVKAVFEKDFLQMDYSSFTGLFPGVQLNEAELVEALGKVRKSGIQKYIVEEINEEEPGSCIEKTFVISGDLETFEDHADLKAYIEYMNGSVDEYVTAETDFVICSDKDPSSAIMQKAKELGIPVITEDEFIERFGDPEDFEETDDEDVEEETVDEHLTIRLPYPFSFSRDPVQNGRPTYKILYHVDEKNTVGLILTDPGKEAEIPEEKRNWKGNFHIVLSSTLQEKQVNALITVKGLFLNVMLEHNRHLYIITFIWNVRDREDLENAANMGAMLFNELLPNIIIDGEACEAEELTATDFLKVGGLEKPMSKEEAQEAENKRMMEELARRGPTDGPGVASVRRVYTDPITGEIKRDLFMERAAADGGDPEAMVKLSEAYRHGDGVAKDDKKATELMEKAAQLDEPTAQYNMGIYCARGEFVKRDFAAAIEWMEKALKNGDEDARKQLGILKRLYSPGLEQRANAGDAVAQAQFSRLLSNYFSKANVEEALKMAQSSVKKGCPKGFVALGDLYQCGMGVEKDPERAAELYKIGAEAGDPDCQFKYAYCLDGGFGVQTDAYESRKWIFEAAKQGNVDSALLLSSFTAQGIQPCTTEDLIGFLLKAEELEPENADLADNLGVQYINLDPPDYLKGIQWYDRAAELGSENGKRMAHLHRYRLKLIEEGSIPADMDPMDFMEYLQKNDLMNEAFYPVEHKNPDYDIDELLEGLDNDDADAIKKYAYACYYEGDKVYDHGIDKARSMTLLEELSKTDPEASAIIGLLYQNGTGIEKDIGKAETWLAKAAHSGNVQYVKCLAHLYLDEKAPYADKDRLRKALLWFGNNKDTDEESQFYSDILSYGKKLFDTGYLKADDTFEDTLKAIMKNARTGDPAAKKLNVKYGQLFKSLDPGEEDEDKAEQERQQLIKSEQERQERISAEYERKKAEQERQQRIYADQEQQRLIKAEQELKAERERQRRVEEEAKKQREVAEQARLRLQHIEEEEAKRKEKQRIEKEAAKKKAEEEKKQKDREEAEKAEQLRMEAERTPANKKKVEIINWNRIFLIISIVSGLIAIISYAALFGPGALAGLLIAFVSLICLMVSGVRWPIKLRKYVSCKSGVVTVNDRSGIKPYMFVIKTDSYSSSTAYAQLYFRVGIGYDKSLVSSIVLENPEDLSAARKSNVSYLLSGNTFRMGLGYSEISKIVSFLTEK